jgi:3-methyladenine DNA glycosylase AlkC
VAAPLKDFVGKDVVKALGARVEAVYPEFDTVGFVAAASASLAELELKGRISAIARRLAAALPRHFPAAVRIVVAAAEHPDPVIGGWEAWPLNTFVEEYGLDHPREALDAMEHLTRYASSEFAVRPYLRRYPEATWVRLEEWAASEHEMVRRLASEGTRPRLPWGAGVPALVEDPGPGLRIIELLKDDESTSVRRSVANHLNDVSRDHPDLAVETARRWAKGGSERTMALLRHGLRTLVKQGHAGALDVLGFTTRPRIDVLAFTCTPVAVRIGDTIEIVAKMKSVGKTPQLLVIDYLLHYVKADGGFSKKVFKWRTAELAAGQEIELVRRHCLQDMSTRTHHPGKHRIELQVAGSVVADTAFDLRRR